MNLRQTKEIEHQLLKVHGLMRYVAHDVNYLPIVQNNLCSIITDLQNIIRKEQEKRDEAILARS